MGLTTDRNDPGLREIEPSGQQKAYLVLSEEERAKGFVMPVHRSYTHLKCGGLTSMALPLCETYARNPKFYTGTFCCICGRHFDLQFEDDRGVVHHAFEWPDGSPCGSTSEEGQLLLRARKVIGETPTDITPAGYHPGLKPRADRSSMAWTIRPQTSRGGLRSSGPQPSSPWHQFVVNLPPQR